MDGGQWPCDWLQGPVRSSDRAGTATARRAAGGKDVRSGRWRAGDLAGQGKVTSGLGQVSIPAGETSTQLQGLRPLTEYQVTVVALYANSIGEAVSGTARTSEQFC